MARVTYVKSAQQRYETKPVIDSATGEQKIVPFTNKDGSPKTTKRGKPVVMRQTEADKTKPLPPEKCGKCGNEILPGQPYKHISPKSGPYGGRRLVRCADCPTWNVWEYNSSLSSRIAEIEHNLDTSLPDEFDSLDDVQACLADAAEAIRELGQEKEEAADSLESGFGHETSQSEEIREQASALEGWADDIEQTDLDEVPEPEETDCDECDGTGEVIDTDSIEESSTVRDTPKVSCDQCDGAGVWTPDEPTEEQLAEWRDNVLSAARDAMADSPL